jgi:hypothetical protein
MFKNLNQLKNGLQVGMKFELHNKIKDYIRIREIVEVQSNGFWATGEDCNGKKIWVAFPKAKECEFTNDAFIFTEDLIYKYI